MAYFGNDNVHPLAASGAYGTIPTDLYLRKIERTLLPDDDAEQESDQASEQVEHHIRGLLKDFRPDAPFFESDQKRDSVLADDRLNLRYGGSRAEAMPYLPDGTFLDWEFTEKDPRGLTDIPNMRKHRDQQFARAHLVKVTSDEDHSVVESGINPTQMVQNIRGGQNEFRRRYRNFEESMDAWHNGGTAQTTNKASSFELQTTDGTIVDLTESTYANRQDPVSRLSNDPTILTRESTPDHRVKIARYSTVRKSRNQADDIQLNSRVADESRAKPTAESTRRNLLLAHYIADVSKQKDAGFESFTGTSFNKSNEQGQRKQRATVEQISRIINGAELSAAAAAHQKFDGRLVERQRAVGVIAPAVRGAVLLNHVMAESMKVKAMKGAPRSIENIRKAQQQVEDTALKQKVYVESKNRSRVDEAKTANQTREAMQSHHIEQTRTRANYRGVVPMKDPAEVKSKIEYDDYGEYSLDNIERKRRSDIGAQDSKNFERDTQHNIHDFGVFDAAKKADYHDHIARAEHDTFEIERDPERDEDMQESEHRGRRVRRAAGRR